MKILRRIEVRLPRLPTPVRLPSLPRLPGRAEGRRMAGAVLDNGRAAGIAVACTGIGLLLFSALSLAPAFAEERALRAQIAAARRGSSIAQSAPQRSPSDLQVAIATAEAGREVAARPYLHESQVRDLAPTLYECARLSGVEIIALSQPVSPTGKPGAYEIRTLHLQVTAPLPKLIGFVGLIRQASASGFVVANLNLLDLGATHTLSMDILLYVSPYAPLTPAALPPATQGAVTPSPARTAAKGAANPTTPAPVPTASKALPSPTPPLLIATATTVPPTPMPQAPLPTATMAGSYTGPPTLP